MVEALSQLPQLTDLYIHLRHTYVRRGAQESSKGSQASVAGRVEALRLGLRASGLPGPEALSAGRVGKALPEVFDGSSRRLRGLGSCGDESPKTTSGLASVPSSRGRRRRFWNTTKSSNSTSLVLPTREGTYSRLHGSSETPARLWAFPDSPGWSGSATLTQKPVRPPGTLAGKMGAPRREGGGRAPSEAGGPAGGEEGDRHLRRWESRAVWGKEDGASKVWANATRV